MTRIVYSVVSVLLLITGVLSYDHWGNTVNSQLDKLEDIQENSLFPARHIRHDPNCKCYPQRRPLEYSATHHPRYLTQNKCDEYCLKENFCQEIKYSVNVSSLNVGELLGREYEHIELRMCPTVWQTQLVEISVACLPVLPERQC